MAETISEFKHRCIGSLRATRGRFTASGTTPDVVTGLKNVLFFGLQGIDTADNQYGIFRNTTTTTDNARDAMGTVHCQGVASGQIYEFRAEGT